MSGKPDPDVRRGDAIDSKFFWTVRSLFEVDILRVAGLKPKLLSRMHAGVSSQRYLQEGRVLSGNRSDISGATRAKKVVDLVQASLH